MVEVLLLNSLEYAIISMYWGCSGFDRISGTRMASGWQSLNASVKYNWK